jgi:hypothetical protein
MVLIDLTCSLRLVYCSTLASWVYFRTDWNNEVVKVIERLKEGDQTRRVEVQERGIQRPLCDRRLGSVVAVPVAVTTTNDLITIT